MTNTTSQTTSYYTQPPIAGAAQSNQNPTVTTHQPPENGIENMKKSTKYLIAGALMFVLMIGGGAAMYLMTTQQDPRQQASTQPALAPESEPPEEPESSTPPEFQSIPNDAGAPCREITISDARTEWINDHSQIKIDWRLSAGEVREYEIWNISYEPLDEQKPENYYLVNLSQGQTLPASTTSFVVENPNDLKTRRFLIRGILERNTAGQPVCFNQAALCRPPVANNLKVVSPAENTYKFTWTAIQKPDERYEIWIIGVGSLQELGEEKYYLKLLDGSIDKNATSHTIVLDEEAQAINTNRFLIRFINSSVNGVPQCFDQGALSLGTTTVATPTPTIQLPIQADACTMKFTISVPVGATATPTVTVTPTTVPGSTATPTATVTPTTVPGSTATPTVPAAITPVIGCDQLCVTNADCTNSAHICWTVSATESRCRLDSNPDNNQCQAPSSGGQQTVQPTAGQQPVLPETLPEAGPENWGNWLKAGLAILGIGAALLLML